MIHEHILLVISLLLGLTIVFMLSSRLKISYPILLVISGLVISLVPGVLVVNFEPDLVFLVFLPSLLYGAAWQIS